MRKFPKNAISERRMWTAVKEIDCCCNPPANDDGQIRSSNVFVCLSNVVKFEAGVINIYFPLDITEIFRLHNNFTSTVA